MRSILVFLLLFLITINVQGLFDINDLNWSIHPSDNFFMFVNGRWLNRTTIPLSQIAWGGLFTVAYENQFKLKKILDDLIRREKTEISYPIQSLKRRLADFYLAGLDEQAIERTGLEPLRETLIQLQNIQTYQELIAFTLNWYKKMNHGLIFEFQVLADDRNSSVNIVNWQQTGLELPERDYYFRNDPASKTIRSNYVHYIDQLLSLSNDVLNLTTSRMDAEDILSLETQLAVSHRTPFEKRDPELNYNKYNIVELDHMMPNLGWKEILTVLRIKNDTVNMCQPDYYELLNKLIVNQPLNIWKNKIRFTLLHRMAPYLHKDFVHARFHMFDHVIHGQREEKPRWMKIIRVINDYLGDLLGQLFISRHFSMESKERMLGLVENLIDVYHERIDRINWMSNSTKEKAFRKLEKMNKKIGFPSKWKSYNDIHIDRSSYFDSIASLFHHDYKKKLKDLRKPVDRDEWRVLPQTVDASYDTSLNEMIFPAAILQEPFFSFDADDALNYGGVGYVIGHELTHGFDDEGRKYDENGNLHLWWTSDDINAFNSRTKLLTQQYDDYQLFNTSINGRLTLGENIADLGGLEIAYQAFLRTKQAKDNIPIDGLTPKQRFFVAFARTWRVKQTHEHVLSNIRDDRHAPPITRINGALSNMMGFYGTYNVTKGDAMFREPEKRVLIW